MAQATSWILLFSIAALSVVPATFGPCHLLLRCVHAAIYFLAGCAFGLAYADHFVIMLVGLSAFTLVMEVMNISGSPDGTLGCQTSL